MKVVGAKTTKIPIHKITFCLKKKIKVQFWQLSIYTKPHDFCLWAVCSALIKWGKKKIRLKIFESTFPIIINFRYVKNLRIIGGGNSSK